ncbi:alpha/beta hydrolase family protein [Microvirga sp. KLBC 81]|uniref:alpha/beta hydrolase family protein n=1 Tax=Microvirga sp. KLBC 81 TaxID=1862707 RepID=UPI00352F66DA
MSVRTEIFDFLGSQGQHLSGRLDLPEGAATAAAVLAHCFTCCKSSVASVRIARALAARGIGVLRFDFTGLGQRSGDFSDATFSRDVADLVIAVQTMEQRGYPPRILIGHSLGGAAVLAAAGRLPDIAAVVTIGGSLRHAACDASVRPQPRPDHHGRRGVCEAGRRVLRHQAGFRRGLARSGSEAPDCPSQSSLADPALASGRGREHRERRRNLPGGAPSQELCVA